MESKLISNTGTLAFEETCYTNNITVLAALCLNIVNGKPFFSTDSLSDQNLSNTAKI
jgi:hypothetical protein